MATDAHVHDQKAEEVPRRVDALMYRSLVRFRFHQHFCGNIFNYGCLLESCLVLRRLIHRTSRKMLRHLCQTVNVGRGSSAMLRSTAPISIRAPSPLTCVQWSLATQQGRTLATQAPKPSSDGWYEMRISTTVASA